MQDKIKINQQNKLKNKTKRKREAKSKSGITLMVLVITIVIMIILASVSVSLFTSGDGMYNNADTAVIEYKTKSIIEVIRAADMYLEQNNRFDRTKKKLIRDLMDKVAEISEINDKNKEYIIDIRDEEQSATIIDKKTGVTVEIIIDENDRVTIETNVVDNVGNITNMTAPRIDSVTITPQEPEKAKVVTITITATEENSGIAKIKFPDGSEISYGNAKTVTTDPYEIKTNGEYRFVVVGANGRQAIKTVKITNVKEAVVGEIEMVIQNPEPTADKTSIKITYDEEPIFNGQTLTNSDRYQYKIGDTGSWQKATNNPMPIDVTTNGIVYARYYDGRTGYKTNTVTVNNIDKLAPNEFDLQVTASDSTITVSAVGTVTDRWTDNCAANNRGIAGYQFQLLASDGTTILKNWTPEEYPYHQASSYTFSQAQDGVEIKAGTGYVVNMRAIDKAGNKTPARSTGSEETNKVTTKNEMADPIVQANIGDFVNYSVTVNEVTYDKWRILHMDTEGHMEIVCYNGPNFKLGESGNYAKSISDYANAIKLLNEASVPYKNGTYGVSARHLGTTPTSPDDYDRIPEGYVQYYNGRDAVPAETLKWIEQTHHETDMTAIGIFSTTNNAGKSKLKTTSWLGSRCVAFYSGSPSYFYFRVRDVAASGDLSYRNLYLVSSDGSQYASGCSYALAPVVSLKSGIKIEKWVGQGTEDNPWILCE